MKIKKEYIILTIVIIALCVYLFMRPGDRTLYQLPEVPQISKEEINKIQITNNEATIVLNRKDNIWYIAPQEYPADSGKLDDMLKNIAKFTLTALVSESKNYNRYDLAEDTKINIKAWQGDNLRRDVDVGKTASSFRHTFVKLVRDDRVFHARGNIRNTFEVTIDDLRDKAVLSFKPADIGQIQITKNQESLAFTKTQAPVEVTTTEADKKESASSPPQKPVWQTADGRTGDKSMLTQMLNTLSNLRCDEFIDDRKREDFSDPLYTLQLKGAEQYSLSIFPKTKEKDTAYPAISSANDYPFLLSSTQVERIMKDPSEILRKPAEDQKKTEPQKPES